LVGDAPYGGPEKRRRQRKRNSLIELTLVDVDPDQSDPVSGRQDPAEAIVGGVQPL
jgi:hypothetical protein